MGESKNVHICATRKANTCKNFNLAKSDLNSFGQNLILISIPILIKETVKG